MPWGKSLNCYYLRFRGLSRKAGYADRRALVINTVGPLRLPTTYDYHPYHPSIPSHPIPQSLFDYLNRPWIDLSRPPMTYSI